MGFFRASARFLVKTMLDVAMVPTCQMFAGRIRDQLKQLRNACPACKQGHMHFMHEQVEGVDVYGLGCSKCSHVASIDIPSNPKWGEQASTALIAACQQDALSCYATLSADETQGISLRMRIFSRVSYLGSGLALVLSAWGAWTDRFVLFTNTFGIAVFLFSLGLKQSYRHWQFVYRRFYEPGQFKGWLLRGQWLV